MAFVIDEGSFEVALGESTLVFRDPELRSLVVVQSMNELFQRNDLDGIWAFLGEHLLEWRGAVYRDGTPGTADTFRERRNIPIKVAWQVAGAYVAALVDRTTREAEAKKDAATTPPSGS